MTHIFSLENQHVSFNHYLLGGIMPSTLELIQQVTTLPVEDRTLVVDSLLRSLNTPEPSVDEKWAGVAERRLEDLRSRGVAPIPGDAVFSEIRLKFGS